MYEDAIRAVSALPGQTRRQRLDGLNELFRAGTPPDPALDGPYDGEVVALDIAPGVSAGLEWLLSLWIPWKGKHLSRVDSLGDNIFTNDSRLLFKLLFPFYKGARDFGPDEFRAFTFETKGTPGKVDPDRQVLNIDYECPDNPAQTIRRIIDELTQIDEGLYLGKIHFKLWWGRWKMVGYFSLRSRQRPDA